MELILAIFLLLSDTEIETVCVALKGADRVQSNPQTRVFEKLGCCYNDGLKEPEGC